MKDLLLDRKSVVELAEKNQIKSLSEDHAAQSMIYYYFEQSNANPCLDASIVNIWSVKRPKEEQAYRRNGYHKIGSTLLWHGSLKTNIVSILNNGLKTRKKDHPFNQKDFGAAIYFADRVNKSIAFSCPLPDGYLFLCQVATGKM